MHIAHEFRAALTQHRLCTYSQIGPWVPQSEPAWVDGADGFRWVIVTPLCDKIGSIKLEPNVPHLVIPMLKVVVKVTHW